MKKVLIGMAALLVSVTMFGVEVHGSNNNIIEVEQVRVNGTTDSTIKYVFLDGSMSFGDSGFSLGYHVAKKENSGNWDLNIIEIYPRYTFKSINGWTPGIELGYKSETMAFSDGTGGDNEKIKVRPWISGNITDTIGLYSEFVYEGGINNKFALYELNIEPSFKLTDSTKVGFGLKYGEEFKGDTGDKNFDKYFGKLFLNKTINTDWSAWGVVEYEHLKVTNGEKVTSIKPIAGASYKITDNANVFGEVSYKFGTKKSVDGTKENARIPFFKVGVGYSW